MKKQGHTFDRTVEHLYCINNDPNVYVMISKPFSGDTVYSRAMLSAKSSPELVDINNIEHNIELLNKTVNEYSPEGKEVESGWYHYKLKLIGLDSETIAVAKPILDDNYCYDLSYYRYYQDKNGYYFVDDYNAPIFRKLKIKKGSISKLVVYDHIFAKTDEQVFFMGKQVRGVDAQSFEPVFTAGSACIDFKDHQHLVENNNFISATKTLL